MTKRPCRGAQPQALLLLIPLAVVVAATALQGSAVATAGEKDAPDPLRERLKPAYEFDTWAGKTKREGELRTLKFTGSDFADLGTARLESPEGKREREFGLRLSAGKKMPHLTVRVYRMDSALAVHESLLDHFTRCALPPPVYRRATKGPAARIGDVCFVPTGEWRPTEGKGPVVMTLLFARNNVYVKIGQYEEGKEEYWDLVPIAKRIDDKIVGWLQEQAKSD